MAGLLLAMLAYQGKCLCDRVSSLERNQVRIMVALGIEPVVSNSWESLKNPCTQAFMAARLTNHENQSSGKMQEIP